MDGYIRNLQMLCSLPWLTNDTDGLTSRLLHMTTGIEKV